MDRYQKFIEEKAKKKRELMGTMFFPRTPVLLLDLCGSSKTSYDDLLKGLEAIHLTTLVIAPARAKVQAKRKFVKFLAPEDKADAYSAADFAVVMDGDISKVIKNGCVPISKLDGEKTADYNPLREKGNGFYFENPTKWEMFAAIVRALETYQFPYDWENLIRIILK